METIGARIKKVRKANGLTQSAFAEQINLKQNTITRLETGTYSPSPAVFTLICRTFNVNEEWLRTGEGEMFAPNIRSELEKYLADHGVDEMGRAIIRVYMELTPRQRDMVKAYVLKLAGEIAGDRKEAEDRPPDSKLTTEQKREVVNVELDAEQGKKML